MFDKYFKIAILSIAAILIIIATLFKKSDNNEIVFISSAALSGQLKDIGTEYINGINAYFNYVNSEGGVNGKKIKFVVLDDQYEPAITQKNIASSLKEYDNIFGILGVVGTPTSEEALKIAIKTHTPFLMPFSGAEFLYKSEYEHLYTLKPSYNLEAIEMIKYLKDKNITKISIFYQNDSYGLSALKAIKSAIANSNIKIISDGVYNRNTLSIRLAFDEIAKTKPEAIIMAGAYKPTVEFISKYESSGLKTDFLNFSFVGMYLLESGVKNVSNRVLIAQSTSGIENNNSDSIEFIENFKKYYPNSKPNSVSYEGYLGAKIVTQALRSCDRVDKNDFIKALDSLQIKLFDSEIITYSKDDKTGLKKVYLIDVPKND